jgi:hypothetical protein
MTRMEEAGDLAPLAFEYLVSSGPSAPLAELMTAVNGTSRSVSRDGRSVGKRKAGAHWPGFFVSCKVFNTLCDAFLRFLQTSRLAALASTRSRKASVVGIKTDVLNSCPSCTTNRLFQQYNLVPDSWKAFPGSPSGFPKRRTIGKSRVLSAKTSCRATE